MALVVEERWRKVPGFEKFYEVSSFGNVRSLNRTILRQNGAVEYKRGRVLKQGTKPSGYRFVNLCVNGSQRCCNVHRLVAEAFIPIDPSRHEVNHRDGIKANNMVENIEWATRSENCQHAFDTGLRSRFSGVCLKGEANGACRLSPSDVRNVREMRRSGMTFKEIGKEAMISVPHAYRLASGKRQAHIREVAA